MYYMTNSTYQEKQKNYEDARKDLLQARKSFLKLDQEQKNHLVSELLITEFAIMLQQNNNSYGQLG